MNTHRRNPYIGPRTFLKEDRDLFFGRDREAADLEVLVTSERLVLFYAQSGAGKSSLINACLIPSLEDKPDKPFEVLVTRVSGDMPRGVDVENIYVYNLIHSLQRRESDPEQFRALTLSCFLEKLEEDVDGYFYNPDLTKSLRSTFEPTPWPRILIIDQFEEIFSTNVEAWQKREEFFRQLAQAMQDDPFLWVLLVMREDFVAALDPYAHLLPRGLRVRYYMERLGYEAAVKAIRRPVEMLRPYANGVAEKLAEDLSRVQVQRADGTTGTEPGQYIEPVQLQVVCYSLWENLPPEGAEITEKDLQNLGDVNQSLEKYYDRRVSEVASTKHVRERQIREWFDQKLITSGGIRNMVLQQRELQPGELKDEVIQALQSDLVRAEKRGGATWYELTHDRLVEPILNSNKKWFELNLSPLQRQARLWEDQGRNDNWLLRDKAYTEVLPWVDKHQDELTDSEKEFLDACQKQRDQEQAILNEQAKSARRMRISITVISAIAIVAVVSLILAILSATNANAAKKDAGNQAATARAAEAQAIVQRNAAETAQKFAERSENEAQKQAKISRIGELAAQSVSLREKNFPVSLLLGVEAFKEQDKQIVSVQAHSALLDDSQANPQLEQFLSGAAGPVLSVAFSPDGKTIASGSYDKNIILWDAKTRQRIDQLPGNSSIVRSVAFSPGGKTLAAGSEDSTITLWDVEKRQPIGQPLKGHTSAVTTVAFSPDGQTLASGGEDMMIILWDAKTGEQIGKLVDEKLDKVRSIAFSPDGKTLASGSDNWNVILWDVETQQMIGQPWKMHSGPVLGVAFSPDGQTLASGSYDRTIILWDVKKGAPIGQPLSGHSDIVRSVAFSPDGSMLASGGSDKIIILWDVNKHQLVGQLHGHSDLVNSVAFSPDGKALASGSGDKTVILWGVEPLRSIEQPLNINPEHVGSINAIAISPDGKTLASGSYDKTIILWDMETGQSFDRHLIRHSQPVTSVAFSPDGKTLASGSEDKTVILWDVANQRPIVKPLSGHTDIVRSVAFSADGKTLASGSNDNTILLWNAKTGQRIGPPLLGHSRPVTSVAFSPDGKTLASGSEDTTVILWDVETGQQIGRPLTGHSRLVTSIAFSPDGKILASGSFDRTVILWNVETRQPIVPLSGHSGRVTSVAFSPDGKTLASSSYDKTIILWDVESGQMIGPLSQNPALGLNVGPVYSIAFRPDGETLAASSQNILLWDLKPQTWIEKSCQRAGRNLTPAEWKQYFPGRSYPVGKEDATCAQWPLEAEAAATPTPVP